MSTIDFFVAASYLMHREIIQGFPDGTLRPNEPITYAEFATLTALFFNLNDIIEPDTLNDDRRPLELKICQPNPRQRTA